MKLKLLLFLFLAVVTGMLNAQEPYRNLIISEIRSHAWWNTHVELTNMGDKTIDLSEFKMGRKETVADVHVTAAWGAGTNVKDVWMWLPKVMLEPGESWVMAAVVDFGPEQYLLGNRQLYPGAGPSQLTQIEMYKKADKLLHHPEFGGDETDSVTIDNSYKLSNIYEVLGWYAHSSGLFIEHHFAENDSAVIDQVLGVFDKAGGQNSNQDYDVAGVYKATTNHLIVRKANITTGNVEFVRGLSTEDSEWMVFSYPPGYNGFRTLWWTVGNHGSYVLDENTLKSDVINVDFANKKLTVPWGTRRLDGIMSLMEETPGLVWEYKLNPNVADSLYRSARNGDKLKVFVAGDAMQVDTFDIVVSAPAADANIVVPMAHADLASIATGGPVTNTTQNGILGWPRVTTHASGVDTITGEWFGIPNALRGDTLMAYLEKPANASWEFVMVDGVDRPDLKNGDILKVTSQNGTVKEYFIQVQPFVETSRDFYLSSITWPDIPEYMKGFFGWKGDTIPGFNPTSYNYNIEIPLDVEGIPALIAKTSNPNSKVEVIRATTLSGTREDRTVKFIVTSGSGEQITYQVELTKQKEPSKIQPNSADPFISEYIYKDQTTNNFMEVVNPGNQILDLSNYMFVSEEKIYNPADAIKDKNNWMARYEKYVPGYKWGDETEWAINPGVLKQDVNVNPLVMPGDVFVMALMWDDVKYTGNNSPWKALSEVDVFFNNATLKFNGTISNPWGEATLGTGWFRWRGAPLSDISNFAHMYIFEILNDSIKNGTKPAYDPNDFRLVDAWGMADGSAWNIAGSNIPKKYNTFKRKPEIFKGNPVLQASFGTNAEDSEWMHDDEVTLATKGLTILHVANNIGQHFMNEVTYYKSTVGAKVYKVSDGYVSPQKIRGVITGTTVGTFIDNIFKADEGQSLTVRSNANGNLLAAADLLSNNDTLVVLSADSVNTTKYVLEVNEAGLSPNAVLTSTKYNIVVTAVPKSANNQSEAGIGEITGFEYGTALKTIIANVTVPDGASMSVINGAGAYVSLQVLNFDTVYVAQSVSPDIFFEVLAEDGKTKIVYQLKPSTSGNDAFILSTLYGVSQKDRIVKFVPRGTYVNTFFTNVTLSLGASAIIVDKMGNERTQGAINDDDKVVVTSANGQVSNTYYISLQATEYIKTIYLAYVLSNKYQVDQVNYVISGPTGSTLLTEFYAGITPSMGATSVVVDADGNEKTTGDLNDGDMLKVTSADGALVVMYDLALNLTSSEMLIGQQIEIYPNPTAGKLNIRGIEAGYRIQIYNAVGGVIRDVKAKSSLEILSLDDLPVGMFVIVVSNNNKMIGSFKAIRK
jgi:hypothetical protein